MILPWLFSHSFMVSSSERQNGWSLRRFITISFLAFPSGKGIYNRLTKRLRAASSISWGLREREERERRRREIGRREGEKDKGKRKRKGGERIKEYCLCEQCKYYLFVAPWGVKIVRKKERERDRKVKR